MRDKKRDGMTGTEGAVLYTCTSLESDRREDRDRSWIKVISTFHQRRRREIEEGNRRDLSG